LTDDTIPQAVLFLDLFAKPLVATFDQAHASSDGGAILLKAVDRRLDLTARLAARASRTPATRPASRMR
jgi:hypothetical protein